MDDEEAPGQSAHLYVGMRLDRYELIASLASGGMGEVWLARLQGVRGFEKLVAIKTIRPQYSQSGRFERMFLDEARISSRLQHPNIAPILELGEQLGEHGGEHRTRDGLLYLVMEYVDGEPLSRLRRAAQNAGHRVPLPIALRILADTCAGLHAAHELQDEHGAPMCVVHRDASPHNILVATNGTVKVIDFGVAKARDRCAEATTMGELKGKLSYMPREQAMSADIDRRADIWSIGACLYELVAGESPWESASVAITVKRLMDAEPPRPLPRDVPAAVREIIARSLVHDRDARYPTALAMRRALEEAMVTLSARATSEDVSAFVRRVCASSIEERRLLVVDALDASSARHKVAPASLSAVSIPTTHATTPAPTPRHMLTHVGAIEPPSLRTPTPTSTSAPQRFERPLGRRRSGFRWFSLLPLVAFAITAFFLHRARLPASSSSIRDRMEARPSSALSPLSAPAAPTVEHLGSPTCPSEMLAVAEPLTWTPYCIDLVELVVDHRHPCSEQGPCVARATAVAACAAHGKRLATDVEQQLAINNAIISLGNATATKANPKAHAANAASNATLPFRCARSL